MFTQVHKGVQTKLLKNGTALMGYSRARGKLIHEKNLKSKSRDTCPFKLNLTIPNICKLETKYWKMEDGYHESSPKRKL